MATYRIESDGWQTLPFSTGDLYVARLRFVDVGNVSFSPASNLVAEEPKVSRPSRSLRAFRHDTSLFAVKVGNGPLLDHIAAFRNADFQSRVVQVAASSLLQKRRDRLESLAVRPRG